MLVSFGLLFLLYGDLFFEGPRDMGACLAVVEVGVELFAGVAVLAPW